MTCSKQLVLSRARYGVLHVLYIVLFPLLCFRTVQHVLRMAKMYSGLAGIKTIDTELGLD